MDPDKIFEMRDDLGQWIISTMKDDWRFNALDYGNDQEQAIFYLAERLIAEWGASR